MQLFKALLLSAAILMSPISIAVSDNPVIAALASPKGVAIVGFTYALTTAVSNFLWAFDWARMGVAAEMKNKIQEAGGLSAAAESLVFGFFIPFWCYQYMQTSKSR